jgi:transposase InsO family protein
VTQRNDEDELTRAILQLASEYGRYGYRRITALLREAGWEVGKDRVQRIWRQEGLKVPQKQRPRGRLWLNDGSYVRLRPEHENHVWSYDFVRANTHGGRTLRLLTLIDEYTRKCLAIRVARRLNSYDLIETLADLMLVHGIPEHLRSDNGPEFIAKRLRQWLSAVGAKTLYIEPGSPWENGYCESFNGKLRDECLKGEIFYSREGGPGGDRTMESALQHGTAAFVAGLQTTSAASHLAEGNGAWRYGQRCAFPTSPHPRRRLRTLRFSIRAPANWSMSRNRMVCLRRVKSRPGHPTTICSR